MPTSSKALEKHIPKICLTILAPRNTERIQNKQIYDQNFPQKYNLLWSELAERNSLVSETPETKEVRFITLCTALTQENSSPARKNQQNLRQKTEKVNIKTSPILGNIQIFSSTGSFLRPILVLFVCFPVFGKVYKCN